MSRPSQIHVNGVSHLECSHCGRIHPADQLQSVCVSCSRPLLARYDLQELHRHLRREDLAGREATLWRYHELLPVRDPSRVVSLGEGFTPLIRANRLASDLGMASLFIKDESLNPTGSFKARGICVAVSRGRELGVKEVALPSAGNAGSAAAAYAARAGIGAHVFMPADVPEPFLWECRAYGADVHLIDGLITECGQKALEESRRFGWFLLSTLREPYRIEGKKTLGFEVAEQLRWELPDVILYPTGGGTGLIGIWKSFQELRQLGWVRGAGPRMVVVQAAGCAPLVRAFEQNEEYAHPWENARTLAAGLRVPSTLGDFLVLRALRDSQGTATAVSDQEILIGQRDLAYREGIFACPEGGATVAALRNLLRSGWISRQERVVLFNTGTGLKYPQAPP
ncbi:MAG: threonine synthase [Anaerolineales bacterium]